MNPKLNELLDQLPDFDYQNLLPYLQLIALVEGTQLYGPGDEIDKIIFPVTALIAISITLADGCCIDTATIGFDGLLGLRGLEASTSAHRIYVASSGLAYQINRNDLLLQAQCGPTIYKMCMQAGIQMIRKMTVEVACTNFHTLEQRLSKWILTRHHRYKTNSIHASHQTIADSLGVRREAITHTLPKLSGISCSRCTIGIQDTVLLQQSCCECYFVQRDAHPSQMTLPFIV